MKTRQILYADSGMVLTDGSVYGKVVYLAEDADASAFREITEEEYQAEMARLEVETDGTGI